MSTSQYHLVRLSPDPLRDEPLNIGLVLYGDAGIHVVFPDTALERAARWCTNLGRDTLASVRDEIDEAIRRELTISDDLGSDWRSERLGELFGAITASEPRWIELAPGEEESIQTVLDHLVERLVEPPRPSVFGGGQAASGKLADSIWPQARRVWPGARRNVPFVGRSGRSFTADIYAAATRPVLLSTLSPGSTWQGVRLVESKAFQLQDVRASMEASLVAAYCAFPPIDPEGIVQATHDIMGSIDVPVVTEDAFDEFVAMSS